MVNCKPRLWQGKKEPKRNMDVVKQKVEETSLEAESRKLANFADTEAKLGRRWALSEIPMAEMVTSKLRPMTWMIGADWQLRQDRIPQPDEERSQCQRQ